MNAPQTRTVALHTLGCKLNQTETATIGRQFAREGFTVVPFGSPADVVVLNTCSVTDKADKETRQLVRRIRRESPEAFVAVVGCYAQLRPDEIAALPGVDLVAGTAEKFSILAHVRQKRREGPAKVLRGAPEDITTAVSSHSQGIDRTRGFLKVQDGCDYTCSFCTIPLARGESRSLPMEDVLSDARHLAQSGFREIVLTGVNTGDYGRKEGKTLLSLLEKLVRVDGIDRIRISSVEPNLLSDDLLDFWIGHHKLCNHWHIPMQSGSNDILRAMRRRYGTQWYADRLGKIHAAQPHAGIGADVIVGFPGETDEQFDDTVTFIKNLPLTYLHVFSYSERPWTEAIRHEEQVDPAVKARRSERLRSLSDRKKRAFNDSFIGSVVRILVEGPGTDGIMTGLSEEYVRVGIQGGSVSENDMIDVRVTGATLAGCSGTVVHEHQRAHEAQHAVA